MYPQNNNFQLSAVDENGKPKLLSILLNLLLLIIVVVIIIGVLNFFTPLFTIYGNARGGGWAGLEGIFIAIILLGIIIFITLSKYIYKQTAIATTISLVTFLVSYVALIYIWFGVVSEIMGSSLPAQQFWDSNGWLSLASWILLFYLLGLPGYVFGIYLGFTLSPPRNQ